MSSQTTMSTCHRCVEGLNLCRCAGPCPDSSECMQGFPHFPPGRPRGGVPLYGPGSRGTPVSTQQQAHPQPAIVTQAARPQQQSAQPSNTCVSALLLVSSDRSLSLQHLVLSHTSCSSCLSCLLLLQPAAAPQRQPAALQSPAAAQWQERAPLQPVTFGDEEDDLLLADLDVDAVVRGHRGSHGNFQALPGMGSQNLAPALPRQGIPHVLSGISQPQGQNLGSLPHAAAGSRNQQSSSKGPRLLPLSVAQPGQPPSGPGGGPSQPPMQAADAPLCCHSLPITACQHRSQHIAELKEQQLEASNVLLSDQATPEELQQARQAGQRLRALIQRCTADAASSSQLPSACHGRQLQAGAPQSAWQAQQPQWEARQQPGPVHPAWELAGSLGMSSSSKAWQPQPAYQQQHGGGASGGYDAPDMAPRDDSGVYEPDPSLRTAAGGMQAAPVDCHQTDGLAQRQWGGSHFPWSSEMQQMLRDYFGATSFRSNQKQAINASLAGKDTFVLMPTGGGARV